MNVDVARGWQGGSGTVGTSEGRLDRMGADLEKAPPDGVERGMDRREVNFRVDCSRVILERELQHSNAQGQSGMLSLSLGGSG